MKTTEGNELCIDSLYEFLKKNAAIDGTKRFLFTENVAYTRLQTLETSQALAERLYSFGICKGALVAIRATRSIDTVFLILALHILGAIIVFTDAHSKIFEYIKASGVNIAPQFYITNEDELMDICAIGNWMLKDVAFNEIDSIVYDVPQSYNGQLVEELAKDIVVTDPSAVIFTSGSTGRSKAVLLNQFGYINTCLTGYHIMGHNDKDVLLQILPLHHIMGLAVFINAVVEGHELFIPRSLMAEDILQFIEQYKISRIHGVPTFFSGLIMDGLHKKYNIDSLRCGLIGGGPSTPEQIDMIEKELKLTLYPTYGMSECLGISNGTAWQLPEQRKSGVGSFYPFLEGFILNDDEEPMPIGKTGEICIRGYGVMMGYYNDEEETKRIIDEKGRLHTGDLGYVDENGVLHIVDRKKNIIIRSGENLSPAKIEKALLSLDEIELVAVAAIKDAYFGEVPGAMIVLKKGSDIDGETIKSRLKTKLSKIEIPVKIIFSKSLPLTSSGKIDKQTIIKRLSE